MCFRAGHLRAHSYESTSHCYELRCWTSQERASAVITIVRSTVEDPNELITWGLPQLLVYSNTRCAEVALMLRVVESSWNVMAHGDAREGKWRGNWRMGWVASTLRTTSEHGVSSIITADAHTSAASNRLKWRPLPI